MRFSDWRIGAKLGLAFVLVVVLAALLGAVSLVQLARIHAGADDMATRLLPSVSQAGEVRVLLNRMRRSEAGIVTATRQEDMQAAVDQVQARLSELKAVEAQYATLLNESARSQFQQYQQRKAQYLKLHADLADIAKGVDYSSAEALELSGDMLRQMYAGESEAAFVAMEAMVGRMQQAHAEDVRVATGGMRGIFDNARLWVGVALLACVLLAVVLGVAIGVPYRVQRMRRWPWRVPFPKAISRSIFPPEDVTRWASCSRPCCRCATTWRVWSLGCAAMPRAFPPPARR